MNVQEIFFDNMNYLLKCANIFNKNSIFNLNKKTLCRKISVGVSGGADSLALAILVLRYAEYHGFDIITYTVNHNLREEALQEALYVNLVMQKFGIKHKILHWEHDDIKFGHIENEARKARYNLLRNAMYEDESDILLTAHTENDLVETFLLRKIKHSTKTGLAGISALRDFGCGKILMRPLLNIKKDKLIEFLNAINVTWVHDTSNDDEKFQRVKIRKVLSTKSRFHELIIKRVRHLSTIRQKTEFNLYKFMVVNVFFNADLLSVEILKKTFYEYEYRLELLQNLIMIVGGAEYPVNFSKCLDKLYQFKKFTLGKCVIDFSEDYVKIYRENKGFKELKKGDGYFFDNRVFVRFVRENSFFVDAIGKNNLIQMYEKKKLTNLKNLERKSVLPAVFSCDSEILFVYGLNYKKDDLEWADIEFGRNFIPFISIYH